MAQLLIVLGIYGCVVLFIFAGTVACLIIAPKED